MNKIQKIGLLIWMFFTGFSAYGQQQDSMTVVLQANPGKESVKLRWAVTQPYQWNKSLKFGYIIERYTIKRNGVVLSEEEKTILTPEPIKTAPLDSWEHIAQNNNYGAVLAQALYGEKFEITGIESGDIMSVVNLSEETDQRHAFALSAADMCFECACLAGWGYEDKQVVKGEYYLYRVIPVGEGTEKWNIQYGFAYTGIDDHHNLPKPVFFSAEFGDKMVRLQWDISIFDRVFNAWQVEKSEDNSHFESIGLPVTSWNEGSSIISIADSLAENGKTYYYRVRGRTIFGDLSEPSDVASGKGIESMKSVPVIVRSLINDEGWVEINWEFDEAAEHLIQSFELMHSTTGSGTFRPVMQAIPVKERSLLYKGALEPSNYFAMAVNPVHGIKVQSFPVLIMAIDTIPPAAPQQLIARADTLGRVFISWAPNAEKDLRGYKLYRGQVAGEELIPLPIDLMTETQYTDSVNLNNLNTHVYYALKAFDMRYNQSEFSKILAVEKPLKVQPSPPVFNNYKAEDNGIFLSWVNSPGSEVVRHILYRAQVDSMVYRPIAVFESDTITSYIDSAVEGGRSYSYQITALSRWQVESDPSPALQVGASPGVKPIALKQLKGAVDNVDRSIKLSWKPIDPQKIKGWKIYRSVNNEPLSLWKDMAPENESIEDTNSLKIGNLYHYMIYAVMKDGSNSRSEKISVVY